MRLGSILRWQLFFGASLTLRVGLAVALVGMALIATATPAQATPISFGTITLTQVTGSTVNVDVVLSDGNRFVETIAGAEVLPLFLFNDSLLGSTITNISATLNGVTETIPGGLTGLTNLSPAVLADGFGTFTASVECTNFASCNGGSTPNINDLHFTVTNATLAQLETANSGLSDDAKPERTLDFNPISAAPTLDAHLRAMASRPTQ
jgi:hypothetical protein